MTDGGATSSDLQASELDTPEWGAKLTPRRHGFLRRDNVQTQLTRESTISVLDLTSDTPFADEHGSAMAEDVLDGLTRPLKELPSKYLYDAQGAELYDRICELPEYYLARTEAALLELHSREIARVTGAHEVLELGSGNAAKTRCLLDALLGAGTLGGYIPMDVTESVVRRCAADLATEYPELRVRGVIGDFERDLDLVPRAPGSRLVLLLGGTIGNFPPGSRRRLLRKISKLLGPDDHLLIGWGLVGDPDVVREAYDDPGGITAAFNRNALDVLNQKFDANFEPTEFEHVALFDPHHEWVEMRLRARRSHVVRVERLGLDVSFEAGEEMRTEVSAKFTRERVVGDLAAGGLSLTHWRSDDEQRFALSLARRAGRHDTALDSVGLIPAAPGRDAAPLERVAECSR